MFKTIRSEKVLINTSVCEHLVINVNFLSKFINKFIIKIIK